MLQSFQICKLKQQRGHGKAERTDGGKEGEKTHTQLMYFEDSGKVLESEVEYYTVIHSIYSGYVRKRINQRSTQHMDI